MQIAGPSHPQERPATKNAAINRLCGGLHLPSPHASPSLLPACVRRSANGTTARGNDRYVLTVRTRETFIRESRKGLKMLDALERILKGLKAGALALVRASARARARAALIEISLSRFYYLGMDAVAHPRCRAMWTGRAHPGRRYG